MDGFALRNPAALRPSPCVCFVVRQVRDAAVDAAATDEPATISATTAASAVTLALTARIVPNVATATETFPYRAKHKSSHQLRAGRADAAISWKCLRSEVVGTLDPLMQLLRLDPG